MRPGPGRPAGTGLADRRGRAYDGRMKIVPISALLLAPLAGLAQAAGPNPYDGRWSATLVCEDSRPEGSLVKGYTWQFPAVIANGVLEAQYGRRDGNSSGHFYGPVQADGSAELRVEGHTGGPEFTVGKVMPGSKFQFRLRGRFEGDGAVLDRVELRPCRATFVRQR